MLWPWDTTVQYSNSPPSRKLSFISYIHRFLSTSRPSDQFKSHFHLCIHLSLSFCLHCIWWKLDHDVHVSGHKVHCSGPRCSLLVLVRTCMVTSWRLVLMEQTSLSCILLQLPPCPLWTQMSCSVITATLLSLSSVMSVLLFATSCLDPGQVSAVSRSSCMKEHYIRYYRKLKTFSCLSSLDFGAVINAVI